MRWDGRTYDLRTVNRIYRPLWTERRSVRFAVLTALWAGSVLIALEALR